MSIWDHRFVQIARKTASFGFVEGVGKLLNMVLVTFLLQKIFLDMDEFDNINIVIAIEAIASNVFLMGHERSILRFYSNEGNKKHFLYTILFLWAFLPALTAIFLGIVGVVSDVTFFGIPAFPHLFTLTAALALFNLNRICLAIGRTTQDLKIFALYRVGYQGLKLIWILALGYWFGTTYSYILGLTMSFLCVTPSMARFLGARAERPFDPVLARRLCLFSWPFLFHVVGGNILGHVCEFILKQYGRTGDVSMYATAYRLGMAGVAAYLIISIYFEPAIYRNVDIHNRSEKWLAYFGVGATTLGALLGILILVLLPFAVTYYYGEKYIPILAIAPVMVAATLIHPIYLQGVYRLTASKKTEMFAVATILALGININLSIWLVPSMGVAGGVAAYFISHVFRTMFIYISSIVVSRAPLSEIRDFWMVPLVLAGACAMALFHENVFWRFAPLVAIPIASGASFLSYMSASRKEKQPEK